MLYSIFSSKESSLEGMSNPIFGHSYDESRKNSTGEAKTAKKGGVLGRRREWSYRKKLLILTVVLVSIVGIAAAGRFLLWSEEGGCDSSDQCQNGGTCQEYGGGYKCICADGWGGKNCNTAVVCYSSPMHKLEKWGKNSGGFDDTSSSAYSRFGSSVANVGYVNGDVHMDTAVGAEYDGEGERGSVFIIFAQNNRIQQQLKITTKNVDGGLSEKAHFGAAITRVGDILTKSETATIAVGAPGVDSSQGAIYFVKLEQDNLGVVTGSAEKQVYIKRLDDYLRAGDEFGHSVASLGGELLEEDGSTMANVLAVGAPGSNGWRGAVYLLSVDDTNKNWVVTKIGHMEGGLATELDAGDAFGSSIALLGDVDGDGVMDIAVGAPKDDDGGTDTGAVYILFLSPSKDFPVKSEQKISSLRGGLLFSGLTDHDQFGQSITMLGDLDGDGVVDLVVGAPGDDGIGGGEWNRGAVHAILLTQDGKVKGNEKLQFPAQQGGDGALLQPGDAFGYSVACMSRADIAGRSGGNARLVVGAYFDSHGGQGYGAVYVVDVSPRSVPLCELGTRCKENYSRTDTCQAVDECKVLASPCRSSVGADGCVDTEEGYYCICEDNGWEGAACEQDVDECRLQEDDCNDQVCNNTPGKFTCDDCTSGYEMDAGGKTCLQINECDRDKENKLCGSNGGSCKDTDGSYECICPEFWEGDCSVDADECKKNTDDCTDTQRCENKHGEKWTCWDCGEFEVSSADGLSCVDRNECDVPSWSSEPPCGKRSSENPLKCVNVPKGFLCESCPSGYLTDRHDWSRCENIDECSGHESSLCKGRGEDVCVDTPGSYTCEACPINFLPDRLRERCTVNPCVAFKLLGEPKKMDSTNTAFIPDAESTEFGASVAGLDLDGKAPMDMVVGAPGTNTHMGAVHLIIRAPGGETSLRNTLTLEGWLQEHDRFGMSVASLGDLDRDSVHDIVVGAPGDDENVGAVYVIFLTRSGEAKGLPRKIGGTTGYINGRGGVQGLGPFGYFGRALANLGDIDGDAGSSGAVAIAVGAPGTPQQHSSGTGFHVLRLNKDGEMLSEQRTFIDSTAEPGFPAGDSLCSLGDFYEDAAVTIAVGHTKEGAVHLVKIDSDGHMINDEPKKITSPPNTDDAGYGFGAAVTSMGAMHDRDTLTLAVGASLHDFKLGRVEIILLESSGGVKRRATIRHGDVGVSTANGIGNHFGSGIANLGDEDMDAVYDLAVGAPGSGSDKGAAYVVGVPFSFNGVCEPQEGKRTTCTAYSYGGMGSASHCRYH